MKFSKNFIFKKGLNLTKKLAISSFIIIFFTAISGVFSFITLTKSRNIDNEITNTYYPLTSHLKELGNIVDKTKSLSTNWMYLPNPQDKQDLRTLLEEEYPKHRNLIIDLIQNRDQEQMDSISYSLKTYDEIIPSVEKLMNSLNSEEDYLDDMLLFDLIPLLEDNIVKPLDNLKIIIASEIKNLDKKVESFTEEKFDSFNFLENVIIIMTLLAVIAAILATYFSTKSIVGPIAKVNELIKRLGRGELPPINLKESDDEVGQMIRSLKSLRDNLQSTSNFANEIIDGNLEAEYALLSENDVLGSSLLAMKDNLKSVINQTNEVVRVASEEGNLDAQIAIEDKKGAWKYLCESINTLFDSISKPIRSMQSILAAMADGNLVMRYTQEEHGEVLKLTSSLNFALDNLNDLLENIAETATVIDGYTSEMLVSGEEMSSNTGEIASAISQMSRGAQSQVSQVDESSQLVENILASSKEMANKSEAINTAAQKGVSDSERGLKMVENVAGSINEIMSFSSSTNESMRTLLDRSNEIERVLGVIADIASQTNLLALNAAIEAAQAGDAGRGFAVVAEEIRKLAEDSRSSAKEIEKLINDVNHDTQKTAEMMSSMNSIVEKGVNASQEASEVFNDMAVSSSQTLSYSEDILKSSQEQSDKIMSVVNITESIVVIAEQTSAGTEEVASSATELSSGMTTYINKSKSLNDISEKLRNGLSQFKLGKEEG